MYTLKYDGKNLEVWKGINKNILFSGTLEHIFKDLTIDDVHYIKRVMDSQGLKAGKLKYKELKKVRK